MEGPIRSFDMAFDEVCKALPEIFGQVAADEQAVNPPFVRAKAAQPHAVNDIEFEIAALRKRCRNGLSLILRRLHSHRDPAIQERAQQLEKELANAFDRIHTPAFFTQAILKVVSGQTWREAFRLPRETVDLLYIGAKGLFDEGLFSEAMDSFAFLAWFEARQYDFWIALGHSQFHSAQYSAAIGSYSIAFECLPEESWPDIYSAACFEALGDIKAARLSIATALTREKKKPKPNQELIRALEERRAKYR